MINGTPMNNIGLSLFLGMLCFGCNRSREPAPTPPTPVPTNSQTAAAVANSAVTQPTGSVFTPPAPWSTVEPAASSAPASVSDAQEAPPSDLGSDARPVRFTKNAVLVKSLDQLSSAWTGHVDQYGMDIKLTKSTPGERDQTRTVDNCAEFIKAVQEGFHTSNALDYDSEGYFLERCVPVWFLRRAWPSRKSYVGDLRFDVAAPLSLLPAELDVLVSTDRDAEKQAAVARGDALLAFHPGLRMTKKDAITVEWAEPKPGTMEMTLKIMAFGDANHDGLEDVLFFQLGYNRAGSYRTYRPVVMTRKQEKGPLEVSMELNFQ